MTEKKINPFQHTHQTLFLNLNEIDSKGQFIVTEPLTRLGICLKDCHIFGGMNEKECDRYCYSMASDFQSAIYFARDQCPSFDPHCCKEKAKDNDFAYLYCIQKGK